MFRFFLFFLLALAIAIIAQAAGAVQDTFRIVGSEFQAEMGSMGSVRKRR